MLNVLYHVLRMNAGEEINQGTRKRVNLSSYTGSVWRGLGTALTQAHLSNAYHFDKHFFGTAEVNTRGVASKMGPCGARTAGSWEAQRVGCGAWETACLISFQEANR